MKKIFFAGLLFVSFFSFSQTKLGLKFAPVISTNRVTNDALTADNFGNTALMSFGLIVDNPLSDTYFFSSGLVYIPKRMGFQDDAGSFSAESYKAQYLQVPLTLKLFTNEIAPDLKAYFQLGAGLDFKVYDEAEEAGYTLIEKFNPFDFNVILGTGAEYRLGINTTLFAGISYHRGLLNTIDTVTDIAVEDLQVRNTIVSIDLGVKF